MYANKVINKNKNTFFVNVLVHYLLACKLVQLEDFPDIFPISWRSLNAISNW